MIRNYFAIVLLMCCAGLTASAQAHLTPNSEANIDFGKDTVVMDIIIPQGEYAAAANNSVLNSASSRAAAKSYLEDHIRFRTLSGQKWLARFDQIEFVTIAGPPDLHAIMTARPPKGLSAREMMLEWDAVLDTIPNHSVLILARQDFASGKVAAHREILGALQGERRTLQIDRGRAQPFLGFLSAIWLGMQHIAMGHDHLLFLIALLLPAPLVASQGRWLEEAHNVRKSVWAIAKIVTAFTIGHSLTLMGAAFFNWQLSSAPVEILIALSIFISAVHAYRPIFPGRESIVAGCFGLVHGLAFATLIANYGLDVQEKLLTILGFNLGIEFVQLLVMLSVLPALLILANLPSYLYFRKAMACFTGCAALAWMSERVTGVSNPVATMLDVLLSQGVYLIAALTLVAVLMHFQSRKLNKI